MSSSLGGQISATARARAARSDFPASTIDRIRAVAARLAAEEVAPDDVRHALALLTQHADIDANVPTASRLVPVRYLKLGVKKLVMWYLRYIAGQISVFGGAVVRLAEALALRIESLEGADVASAEDQAAIRGELADLEARVRALEARADV